jgi:3-oxoacyl-[acyl-carrier protein] reductase
MRRFEGKSVLVTGASRGLGRGIAEAFGREGARVGVGYRVRKDDAERTLGEIMANGGTGMSLALDVRDPKSVEASVAEFARDAGLDVLVNNAALVRDQLFAMMSAEQWEQVIGANLTGTYHCCRAAVTRMMARRRGAIVNVASVAGLRASPGQANYAASKGGILALTGTLAAELAQFGIRVNAVVPGLLSTGMGQRLDRRIAEDRLTAIPLGRFGAADEVARAVLFLASDDASYIVGQSLVVDGGLSL